MSLRPATFAFALAALVVATAASAQTAPAPLPLEKPGPRDLVEPPASPPKPQRGDRTRNLDFLFGALKVAPDDASAKNIEDRIWALWLASGSDTCNLLMSRVKTATDAENYDLAIRLLDAIIEIRPNYVEALNRRATVFFLKKDYASSLADLSEVLTREPRHFGALVGTGAILQDVGNDKEALEAYRRALAVHPRLQGVADKVKALAEKIEGRDI